MLWMKLTNEKIKYTIGIIYMPQESRTNLNTLKEIYKEIEVEIDQSNKKGESTIILGDFNCKVGNYIKNNKEEVTKGGKLLLNMIKKYNLDIVNRLECCEGLWTRKEGKFIGRPLRKETSSSSPFSIAFETA